MSRLKFTSDDIELACWRYFMPRRNIIVPNVSWGLMLHECDLLVVTPAGLAYEVEIKVSKADILADRKKGHGHKDKRVARLYFAVPRHLEQFAAANIPERAGLLTVAQPTSLWAQKQREAKLTSDYRWTAEQRFKLAQLGCMRLLPLLENLRRWKRDDEQALVREI